MSYFIEDILLVVLNEFDLRHDICHKHHKQRLCKIFRSRVKFHIVDVLLEQFMYVLFQFLVIFSHVN